MRARATPTRPPRPSPDATRRVRAVSGAVHSNARWVAWLVGLAALVTPLPALGQANRTSLDIFGFDKDAKQVLVKIDDNNIGLGLRMYDLETGKPAKRSKLVDYARADEVPLRKKLERRYKIKDAGIEDMRTEDKKLAFFGVLKDETLVIAVTDYKRLGKVMDVQLHLDEESGARSTANLRSMVWSSDRKLFVLVVTQKLKGAYSYERDELYTVKWNPEMVRWVEPPAKKADKDEKKDDEEKEEDKGWWPF